MGGIVWGGLSLSNPSKCGIKIMKYALPEEACAFSQILGNHLKALLNVKIFPGEAPRTSHYGRDSLGWVESLKPFKMGYKTDEICFTRISMRLLLDARKSL